jgi:hypothetical protein
MSSTSTFINKLAIICQNRAFSSQGQAQAEDPCQEKLNERLKKKGMGFKLFLWIGISNMEVKMAAEVVEVAMAVPEGLAEAVSNSAATVVLKMVVLKEVAKRPIRR